MRREYSALLALTLCFLSLSAQAQAPAGDTLGVPQKVGAWQLVRKITGEPNHFLYANQKRSFSLFIAETKSTHPLQAQQGWKTLRIAENFVGFLHQDSRNPERTAIVFKHATQRRMA